MNKYSKKEIEEKVKEIWAGSFFYDEDTRTEPRLHPPEFSVSIIDGVVRITAEQMYDAPNIAFSQLMELANFFGTNNINDDDRFGYGGCDTCDYGSSYGWTLTVRP